MSNVYTPELNMTISTKQMYPWVWALSISSPGADFDVKVATMFDVPFGFGVKVQTSNILEFCSLMNKGYMILILFNTMW